MTNLHYKNAQGEYINLETKIELLDWQKTGLSYTASGYGAKIPTQYKVFYNNKWRRVYCKIYSNIGTCFIGKNLKTGIIIY